MGIGGVTDGPSVIRRMASLAQLALGPNTAGMLD
jgi:hypothetical protein